MNHIEPALVACGLVATMFIAIAIGLRRRIGAVLLVLLSVVWFAADKDFEGDVLIEINRAHGLVTADLVGVLALVVAGWLWWVNRSTSRAPRRRPPERSRRRRR